MISLKKCYMCGTVIDKTELAKADIYDQYYCKKCDTWLNDFVELYHKVVA